MVLINYFYSTLFFINFLLSVGSQSCNSVTEFLKNNKFFLLNTPEFVVFLPTKYSYENFTDSDWAEDNCLGILEECTTQNYVSYKGEDLTSLSETDLKITNDELTDAIHDSFLKSKQIPEVISVFSDRYAIRTRSKKVQVFSINFGTEINYRNPNCTYTSRTEVSLIDGMICKTNFISGIRYGLQCGNIKLSLRPLDEDGNLEFEYKCKPQ
ncbi:unnamed protein product [Aphis gossypii]|uniref:Uncharacterized protein n=1 Tax=Aphis gossypii TaxID=80765 RepID=A0A9P0NGT6_APHGO|nr:unnamed protein product [Aphis gossypii]